MLSLVNIFYTFAVLCKDSKGESSLHFNPNGRAIVDKDIPHRHTWAAYVHVLERKVISAHNEFWSKHDVPISIR